MPQRELMLRVLLLVCLLIASGHRASADNWPQWRGAGHDGVSRETNVPESWSRTEHIKWRAPLPSVSGSTPIIWEDRLFLTNAEGDDLYVLAYSTAGGPLWKKKVGSGNEISRPGEGDPGSPSPVTDGQHIWTTVGASTDIIEASCLALCDSLEYFLVRRAGWTPG